MCDGSISQEQHDHRCQVALFLLTTRARRPGTLLSYNSGYLLQRNWIQICLMGEWPKEHLETLPDLIAELVARRRARKDEKVEMAGR